MSAPGFTPGPWRTGRTDMQSYRGSDGEPEVFVYRGDEERIQVVGSNCWPDARLISAAPDLYAALCAARDTLFELPSDKEEGDKELLAQIDAALAKAVAP